MAAQLRVTNGRAATGGPRVHGEGCVLLAGAGLAEAGREDRWPPARRMRS